MQGYGARKGEGVSSIKKGTSNLRGESGSDDISASFPYIYDSKTPKAPYVGHTLQVSDKNGNSLGSIGIGDLEYEVYDFDFVNQRFTGTANAYDNNGHLYKLKIGPTPPRKGNAHKRDSDGVTDIFTYLGGLGE